MHCNHGAHAACRCVYVGSKPRVVQATKRYFAAMSRDLLAEAWSTLIEVKIEVSIATRNLARVEKVLTQIRDSREDPRLDEEDSKCAKGLLPLRKFDSVLSSLFGMWLALRILRPHSLTLTLTLTLTLILTVSLISRISLISLSLSLSSLSSLFHLSLNSLSSLSHLSLISSLSSLPHLFLISLISLSYLSLLSHLSLLSLSLSPLCLSSFRLSSLSSLAGGSGQRTTYKGLFTPASKKSAVFFPTSLPSTFPFWSASFRPPLGLK